MRTLTLQGVWLGRLPTSLMQNIINDQQRRVLDGVGVPGLSPGDVGCAAVGVTVMLYGLGSIFAGAVVALVLHRFMGVNFFDSL